MKNDLCHNLSVLLQRLKKLIEPLIYFIKYRQRYFALPGFHEMYEIENQALSVERARALALIGGFLYMGVGLLDALMYPELLSIFFIIRVTFAATVASAFFLTFTDWGKRHSQGLIFLSGLVGELGIYFMAAMISGWSSLYFVGSIIITTAITMILPWRPAVCFSYFMISLVGYVLINAYYHGFELQMLIPITFIFLNGFNAVFATMGGELNRMVQLASRLEIEEAHNELKQMEEAKARFFANVSHELRTPLTLILGPLTVAAKQGGVLSKALIDSMISNSHRLLRQVNALLDLAKIDSQEMRCHLETGNIAELVTELYKAAAPGAKERGIDLILEVPSPVSNSSFDIEKIETVVANLISNAIKFTHRGGEVRIICFESDEKVRVEVKDTGPGIAEQAQSKVFARFQQVDDSATRASKGTGLGLAVAKEFTELHGGRIWLESEVGKGTSFFVEVPLVPIVQKGSNDGPTPNDSPSVRADSRSTLLVDIIANEAGEYDDKNIEESNAMRLEASVSGRPVILYADDNRELRSYVDGILKNDYTVLLAQDGEQGLEQVKRYHPDLILSDVMMPKMNGIEFCRAVRQDPSLQSTPFVLLTANASMDTKLEGLEDGADDYLSKPFSEQELLARIKNLVRLREQSEIIKKQIRAAKAIQQGLLPPLTQNLGGVVVEALYEPSEQLSGDFFDTLEVGDWVYVYLADVTGHGIPAAQVTYLVKEIFGHLLTNELGLGDLFDLVRKRYLQHQLEYGLGLHLLRINRVTKVAEYVRSNSPDPILIDERGSAQTPVVPASPLISTLAPDLDDKPNVITLDLNTENSLYLFSDGAYEFTIRSGEDFGRRRLSRSLAECHGPNWRTELSSNLKSENLSEHFPDDLTIVKVSWDLR